VTLVLALDFQRLGESTSSFLTMNVAAVVLFLLQAHATTGRILKVRNSQGVGVDNIVPTVSSRTISRQPADASV
jgi:hypothetical protein